jgi:hypothetical protein
MTPFSQKKLHNDHVCNMVIKVKCGLAGCKKIAKNTIILEYQRGYYHLDVQKKMRAKSALLDVGDSF